MTASSQIQETAPRGLVLNNRQWAAAGPPRSSARIAWTALGVSAAVIAASWKTLVDIRVAAASLGVDGFMVDAVLVVLALAGTVLLWPALAALRQSSRANAAVGNGDLVEARVATAASERSAFSALGFCVVVTMLVLIGQFFIANDLAVSRTFFALPLMAESFFLVAKAFWINVYIFVLAEVAVLVWGLVVAVARLIPGEPARPIRVIATLYTDIFRGMPAIITIYLVGFGIPLTGLPVLKDLAPETYAIIALTLTYGAYVAEVYRAGIESIHRSQVSGARSLGLSYFQTLRYVIVPQAVRRIIPPLLNDFIGLQKDTALVNVVGALDAFNQAKIVASNHFNLSPVSTVAVLFILITIPQARFVDRLVERDQRRMHAG